VIVSRKNDNVKSDREIFMVPAQVINYGIMAPYYATSIVQYAIGTQTRGFHLAPVQSCNIGYQVIYSNNSLSSSSVCTGNKYSNTTFEGRQTLNHANLNSPYFRNVMGVGAYRYAEIAVEYSWALYSGLFEFEMFDMSFDLGIQKRVAIPERVSFEIFKTLGFEDVSIQAYLAYIKEINRLEMEQNGS
jgi:hypothetical protein